jgi:CheY-like chemotaxis protein
MAAETADIVLIEDNPDDAELVRLSLERHRVTKALRVIEDGEEALEYLFGMGSHADRVAAPQPKVIWLDLKLPYVDGFAVLDRIKSDERTKDTPVVVISSSDKERDRLRSYDLGANSYVVKPVGYGEFAATVRECALYWLTTNRPPTD